MLKIPDIFMGWTVDAGSEPTYAEKIRVLPLGVKLPSIQRVQFKRAGKQKNVLTLYLGNP